MATWRSFFSRDNPTDSRVDDNDGLLRIPVDAVVTVNCGGIAVEATALDVSEHGLKIELDEPPEDGPVTVKMVGLPIFTGEVRWRKERQVGVRLSNPIPREYLSTWLQSHGFRRR